MSENLRLGISDTELLRYSNEWLQQARQDGMLHVDVPTWAFHRLLMIVETTLNQKEG